MNLPNNPWGEYKRQNPTNAASISTVFFQICFVAMAVGFTYYALKWIPFQTMAETPGIEAAQTNNRGEAIINQTSRVAPLATLTPFPANISLTKKKIATTRHSGS